MSVVSAEWPMHTFDGFTCSCLKRRKTGRDLRVRRHAHDETVAKPQPRSVEIIRSACHNFLDEYFADCLGNRIYPSHKRRSEGQQTILVGFGSRGWIQQFQEVT
jgi:hypothetical protein